jgi:hypothetical protein
VAGVIQVRFAAASRSVTRYFTLHPPAGTQVSDEGTAPTAGLAPRSVMKVLHLQQVLHPGRVSGSLVDDCMRE